MDIMMQACAFASAGEEARRIGVVISTGSSSSPGNEGKRAVQIQLAVGEWVALIWRGWIDGFDSTRFYLICSELDYKQSSPNPRNKRAGWERPSGPDDVPWQALGLNTAQPWL